MKVNQVSGTPFPLVEFEMDRDESIRYQPSAMVYCDAEIDVDMQFNKGESGGFLRSMVRSAVSGESLVIMEGTAEANGAKIALAPCQPGEVIELKLGAEQWRLRDGAFFACTPGVDFTIKTQSLGKALFAGTGGLFVMETTGTGSMYIETCGKMHRIDLPAGKRLHLDNSHLVAWSAGLDYKTRFFGSGELFTLEFVGPGSIIIQTNCRNASPKSD